MSINKKAILIKVDKEDFNGTKSSLSKKGLFFKEKDTEIILGENAQPNEMQKKEIENLLFRDGIIAEVSIIDKN